MTNFEWITQDERMVANWLSEIGCYTCPAWMYCKECDEALDKSCPRVIYEWLKREA